MKICVRVKNPEKINSPCVEYKQMYQDSKSLFMLEDKFSEMKNFTSLFQSKNSLYINNLEQDCTLGITYKTYYIRVCNKLEDGKTDQGQMRLKQFHSKEIVIINFVDTSTSYVPFTVKESNIENIELMITLDVLVIKLMDSRKIKKVFLFKISFISEVEVRKNS